jgi:PrtD family type I secretion system ABC transporter
MPATQIGVAELRRARNAGGRLLGAVGLFSVFVNLLMLTGPLFMLQIYDRVLGSRSEETLVALFLLVAALYGLMALLDFARGRVLARCGARFQSDLDDRVFAATMQRALNPAERHGSAAGLRDLETIQSLFASPAVLALFDVPWTPVFVAAIFIFHPMMGWMAVAGGGFLIALTLLNNLLTQKHTIAAQSASAEAQGFANEARSAAEIVRAQGMASAISTRWNGLRADAQRQTIGASDWSGIFTAFAKSFRLFLQSAMLALGAWLTLRGELTAGAMIAGSILLGRALAPIEQTLGQWPNVQRSLAGWRTLAELLRTTPTDEPTTALPRPAARIELKGATVYAPGSKNPTLTGVSFIVEPGQALGVIGKSGSGKSTLARTILGIWPPRAGEVRLGGATLAQYDPDELGRHVGYLPQEVTLFSGTVAENIARMAPEPDDQMVVAAAQRANAHEMILSLPDGYKTWLAGSDSLLSGGQRQRIALARALYRDPVLLVLDEPTSALDGDGTDALNNAVREFKNSERAVIIMTHRPMAISECDHLLVLDGGQMRAYGPRDEVLKSIVKNASDVQRAGSRATGNPQSGTV